MARFSQAAIYSCELIEFWFFIALFLITTTVNVQRYIFRICEVQFLCGRLSSERMRLTQSSAIWCLLQTTLSPCTLCTKKSRVILSLLLLPRVNTSALYMCQHKPSNMHNVCLETYFISVSILSLLLSAVPLPSPLSLQFPMVSHSTLKVTWVPGAVDVPAHRVTYSTNHGSDVKQVKE